MKRTQTILITTIVLSITLASVFAFDNSNTNALDSTNAEIPFAAEAVSGDTHNIEMEAVKMPDGMYAYRVVSYEIEGGENLVSSGKISTDPSIPGPTIVLKEGDEADIKLWNRACDDNFVIGDAGSLGIGLPTYNENSLVGMHVHGVHYDISDDATYARVNMQENSGAECNKFVEYKWVAGPGTVGTWPYHDHTFSKNEIGSEDLGLFGTVIVNPANYDAEVIGGFVNPDTGLTESVSVNEIDKEFILWMVSSETLGRSVFYGMEIDNVVDGNGKQNAVWINPPLYAEDESKVRFHVLGMGDEVHAFHLHGHRWVESEGGAADVIDVAEITSLQRKTFVVQVSDNGDETDGLLGSAESTEGWMYHCHVFPHMQDGMSGMLHVLPKYTDDSLPPIGAVFTLSDEPGLWMKTLNAGFLDDLDNVLNSIQPLIPAKNGTGFAPSYLGALSPGFADTEGRSVAIIEPGETVLFNMKDSQTKHTITTLIYPTEAERIGGNGILRAAGIGHFDTQLGIRGSTFLTDFEGVPVGLDTPGLYVFVCKIHPYMFSAVVVDDKDTYAQATINEVLIEEFPLFDLSPNLEILTRHINDTDSDGILNITDGDEVTFPINVSPATPVPLALLKTFSVITDPSNWKDYTQDEWEVNLIPGVFTTNNNSTWVTLLQYDETIAIAEAIGLTPAPGEVLDNLITANLTSVVEITEEDREPPKQEGIGEIWVNTQFERTLNKNFDGTPNDKPGTITVVDTDKWKVERKIALPEINMNHPHNMWTDAKNEVVYQTQWFDKRMAVIDRESGELIHDRIVGESPSHVMTSPVDGKIYIAMNGEEQVTELDPTTYEITKQISTGFRSHPHGHWISSDGQYIVTPDFLGLRSTIIDLEDGTTVNPTLNPGVTLVENEHPLLGDFTGTPILLGPIATGMMSGEDTYYTADFLGNSLSVVDISDAEVTFQVDLLEVGAGLPIQTPVSPDDKWVVTANVLGPHGAAITVVDTSNQVIVATLDCDPGCHGVQWGAKEDGGYYAYVSNKFSNALIVVDPDPNGDGDGLDAKIAGKIILADEDRDYEIDDRVIGYDGMGGQGVLAIPNVYDGWIQNTVALCDIGNDKNKGNGPCGKEIKDYVKALDEDQKDPIP